MKEEKIMYNLLISYDKNSWEGNEFQLGSSRYLEYTIPEIFDKLKSFTDNLEYLKTLPCLFGIEGTIEPYKFGRIVDAKKNGNIISIKYEIDESIDPIPFMEIKKNLNELDIREWEINRTHWAVKDVNLFDVLKSIGISIEEKPHFNQAAVPTSKKEKSSTVTTVTGFIQKIFNMNISEEYSFYYRGHSNKISYKLEPSLFRKDAKGNYLYLQNENILYKELLVSNSADFQSDLSTLDKLVRMQHYSLPTRMLDITTNPLTALYFSCVTNTDIVGEVIIFAIHKKLIKYFDSDTASCMANLARLPYEKKEKIDYNLSNFNEQEPIEKLHALIKEEKPYFKPNIKPKDLKSIICVKGKKTNDRIISQSGAFLLFGHDAVLDENGVDGITINRISVDNKGKILEELDTLNINESSLFPNIESSAKYVREKYKVTNN